MLAVAYLRRRAAQGRGVGGVQARVWVSHVVWDMRQGRQGRGLSDQPCAATDATQAPRRRHADATQTPRRRYGATHAVRGCC